MAWNLHLILIQDTDTIGYSHTLSEMIADLLSSRSGAFRTGHVTIFSGFCDFQDELFKSFQDHICNQLSFFFCCFGGIPDNTRIGDVFHYI